MDMTALGVAAVLVLVAAGLLYARTQMTRGLERLAAATSCRPADVAAMPPGTLVHVAGTAQPGPTGTLRSPVSATEVVWHRVCVTEERDVGSQGADGSTQSHTETKTVSDEASSDPFVIADDAGTMEVAPGGRPVVKDVALLTDDRRDRQDRDGWLGGIEYGSYARRRTQEWGLPVGTHVHAVGVLATGPGGVARLDVDTDPDLVISTLDPEAQSARTRRHRLLATIGAGAAGVAAVVAAVIGFGG